MSGSNTKKIAGVFFCAALVLLLGFVFPARSQWVPENTPQLCGNNQDDDGDSSYDRADSDCRNLEVVKAWCSDGLDNEGIGWVFTPGTFDGLIDGADPDCAPYLENTAALCSDNTDNDGDTHIDIQDTDCLPFVSVRLENTQTKCTDGADNDSNGVRDSADPNCARFATAFREPTSPPPGGGPPPPVHTSDAYQYKPGKIGAFDLVLNDYYQDRMVGPMYWYCPSAARDPISGQLLPGKVKCDYVRDFVLASDRDPRSGPRNSVVAVLPRLTKPKHYHVEVSRVTVGAPAYCESIDGDPPCSISVPFALPTNVARTQPLNKLIMDEFCKDDDGCQVVVGMKDWSPSTQRGNVQSAGPHTLFIDVGDYVFTSTSWSQIIERSFWRSSATGNNLRFNGLRQISGAPYYTGPGNADNVFNVGDCALSDAEAPPLTFDTTGNPGDYTFQFALQNNRSAFPGVNQLVCMLDVWD